jgi:hypothetical protein
MCTFVLVKQAKRTTERLTSCSVLLLRLLLWLLEVATQQQQQQA